MNRRDSLLCLGAAAALAATGTWAQSARRIGIIRTSRSYPERYKALLEGLRALGWEDGRNLAIEWRDTDGDNARARERAASLVAANVELIVVNATQPVRLVREAAPAMPVVAAAFADPVASGFAQSLARPGGSITGVAISYDAINEKQFELAVELLGKASRFAFISNPDNKATVTASNEWKAVAAKRGIAMLEHWPRNLAELDAALEAIARDRPDAMLVVVQPFFLGHRQRIAERMRAAGVPVIAQSAEYVEAGALASYGGDFNAAFRLAARHVDRLLRGAKPAEVPIELLTKLELALNLRTAQALGLKIPAHLLLRADRVID